RLAERGHPADPPPDRARPAPEQPRRARVCARRIGEVRQRRRLGDVRLEGAVRVEPRRPQRPRLPAVLALGPRDGQAVVESVTPAVVEDDGVNDAPAVEPDARTDAALARDGTRRVSLPGADAGQVALDLDPRPADARRRPPAWLEAMVTALPV